ncbi:prepilin-type N-terminal cleavage/methylation domain-containing protein [Uliginosibacterium sp. H3]|uniref:Type II secretion system protein J n=1 Tax=Uliginosibacterium silvisoli TaxID=3114758 RepID=A0ABU6K949_9RHOO|nr:prepilin-type N-terminal cleavage/methylation domain-containing protein [Uliginosibacterium sp. H3]
MMRTKRLACGLTLIELLVALIILAVIGLMSWRGIDGALRSRDHIVGIEQRWQKLSRGFSLIEHNLLQTAERGSSLPAALPDFTLQKLPNGNQRLIFWRMDPVQGSRLSGFRVDGDKLMLLRWMHNVPLSMASTSSSSASSATSSAGSSSMSLDISGSIQPAAGTDIDAESILDGVHNVRWTVHMLTSDKRSIWLDSWPPAPNSGLPRGIRLDMDIDNVGHVQRLFALR